MDPIEYCNDKVAAQGTPGYYTVLFHPPPVRAALVALRALEHELREVVESCTDREVALNKLNYWQQELHAGNASTPHPVTRALRQYARDALDDGARARLLAATAQRISRVQIHDDAEVEQISAASAGTIALACAKVSADSAAGVVDAAIAAERLRLLIMPRRAGLPTHSGIALSTLTACSITPQQVDAGGSDPALHRLRASLLDQVFAATQHADMLIGQRSGYTATCLRMTRCLLAASQRNSYVQTGRLARVAPLRLLWHAWRARP
jgi:phytoene/squalene synthetase